MSALQMSASQAVAKLACSNCWIFHFWYLFLDWPVIKGCSNYLGMFCLADHKGYHAMF